MGIFTSCTHYLFRLSLIDIAGVLLAPRFGSRNVSKGVCMLSLVFCTEGDLVEGVLMENDLRECVCACACVYEHVCVYVCMCVCVCV